MRQTVRCMILSIPKKMQVGVRLIVDDQQNPVYVSGAGDIRNTNITMYPTITMQITRPSEIDENGKFRRSTWDPKDTVTLNKFNIANSIGYMKSIQEGMKIPALYSYQGSRLEINEAEAEKIRQVFFIGDTAIELSAVVIVQEGVDGEKRLEGIKLKFNHEDHSVLLTLNEFDALVWNLDHIDIDNLSMTMYLNFMNKPSHPRNFDTSGVTAPKPESDIKPLQRTFASPDDSIDDIAK